MQTIILVLGITFVVAFISTLGVLLFARCFSLYDTVDERKIHTAKTPRLGGVGIIAGFITGLVFLLFLDKTGDYNKTHLFFLSAACFLICIMGVWDDLKPWRARYKLIVQIAAALLVLYAGYTFHRISFSPLNFVWEMGWLKYPITFFWIIGVTNAMNLFDGLDGLAGSFSILAAFCYAMFFINIGNTSSAILCFILCAAIMGFLMFNLPFPRAKIFMGDGGSQFLGFALAVLPLIPPSGSPRTSIALPYAAAVLIIPLFDMIAAIWRRIRDHKGIMEPDKLHLHHKLMLIGFSRRQTLLLIIMFQLVIILFLISAVWSSGTIALCILTAVYIMALLFFTVIHIRKEQIIEREEVPEPVPMIQENIYE
ncbi:undecaprenyl/decaprenyl-phosphate alpha-N-acetylglucosaminyl 1-phosphate transferase [Brucepastera parasyntrophica]|uniref:MraY family glycosyltransferase n=1 Tax=Brucepastera parasyntrophica TaxID=2880008 RepID=UPI00210D0C0C|nr:MraY family glycosyltransferase [Brucepastera parasyntrophica]ULQ59888.1 undecaprenyl/decaprenyl-phosphate alpha-N-acetylglucosaminyl 1-phosphate transferase [Brucepastera parasyntrophica]